VVWILVRVALQLRRLPLGAEARDWTGAEARGGWRWWLRAPWWCVLGSVVVGCGRLWCGCGVVVGHPIRLSPNGAQRRATAHNGAQPSEKSVLPGRASLGRPLPTLREAARG
jgi:hypothetical protein